MMIDSNDDLKGLPPLPEGSVIDGCVVFEDNDPFCITPDGFLVGVTPSIKTARYLISKQDRLDGCYWYDDMMAIAGKLIRKDNEYAAKLILGAIDRLTEKGVCG